MKFILCVEGHTEKQVVGSFLKRWLDRKVQESVGIKVVRFDGWPEMVKDMPKKAKMHLNGPDGANVIAVLALLDLYGPTFYPDHLCTSEERLDWATREMENSVGDPRFRMFFAVHELEAWLLSQPEIFPRLIAEAVGKISQSPENVNFDAHPSKRLRQFYRQKLGRNYKKTTHGVQLFAKLDPDVAASKCPELRKMFEAMLKMAQESCPGAPC